MLVIAPEGTRFHQPYWRSGFYEIAWRPVCRFLACADGGARCGSVPRELTGSVGVDMDRIRRSVPTWRYQHRTPAPESFGCEPKKTS